MPLKRIAEHSTWEPSESIEHTVEAAARDHLLAAFPPGTYSDPEEINRALQHQFAFYEGLLEETLPGLASRSLMEFILADYDGAARIHALYRRGELHPEDMAYWRSAGRPRRRALKYLAERISAFAPPEAPVRPEQFIEHDTDRVLVCAEELVRLSNMSDHTYAIERDATALTIRDASRFDYIELRAGNEHAQQLEQRMFQDARVRSSVIGQHPLADVSLHNRHLGTALRDTIGLDYTEALNTIQELLRGTRSAPDSFDVPFAHEQNTVGALATALSRDAEAVKRVLSGFTVTPAAMQAEGRKIWKPKQEHRALRRGLFEMPHTTGPHFTWSREMAKEALMSLVMGVPFKRLPEEWTSPEVARALESLVAEGSRWFETRVRDVLAPLGVQGRTCKRSIGDGHGRLSIPQDVGEMDFLGVDTTRRLLILGECKLVRPSTEPALFRDDLSKFTLGADCYERQIDRKRQWLLRNHAAVRQALSTQFPSALSAEALGTVCITFIPTIADYYMRTCRCVALTELAADLARSNGWPYGVGLDTFPA